MPSFSTAGLAPTGAETEHLLGTGYHAQFINSFKPLPAVTLKRENIALNRDYYISGYLYLRQASISLGT